MGKTPYKWATDPQFWDKLPNDLRIDLMAYSKEIERLRGALEYELGHTDDPLLIERIKEALGE